MSYFNFLCLLFCLLLKVSILYSSEVEDIDWDWSNPLHNEKTYFDDSENFTFVNVERILEERKSEDLINSQKRSMSTGSWNSLKWLCVSASINKRLSEENRLQIITRFLKNATDKSIKSAHLFCQYNRDPNTQTANRKITKFLSLVIEQKKITIEPEEIVKAKTENGHFPTSSDLVTRTMKANVLYGGNGSTCQIWR